MHAKKPAGDPVFQHQFSVTFNGEPVPGLTDWICDVGINFVACEVTLTFIQAFHEKVLSHHRLLDLMDNKATTLEVNTLSGSGEVLVRDKFNNLKLADLAYGQSANVAIKSDAAEEPAYGVQADPVYASATIQFGVAPKKGENNG